MHCGKYIKSTEPNRSKVRVQKLLCSTSKEVCQRRLKLSTFCFVRQHINMLSYRNLGIPLKLNDLVKKLCIADILIPIVLSGNVICHSLLCFYFRNHWDKSQLICLFNSLISRTNYVIDLQIFFDQAQSINHIRLVFWTEDLSGKVAAISIFGHML